MYAPEMPAYADNYPQTAVYPAVANYGGSTNASANFKKLNCCACFCAVAIFAVCIAASSTNWYKYSETWQGTATGSSQSAAGHSTVTLNYTRRFYDLQGVTRTVKPYNQVETTTYTDYSSDASSLFGVFKVCQAFVLVALLLAGLLSLFLVMCFADAIRNKLLFVVGMNVLRIVLVLIGVIIWASLCIAFLSFLGITTAFSNEIPSCQFGFCRRFVDSVKEEHGVQDVPDRNGQGSVSMSLTSDTEWGAAAGWYCTLACIPVAILLVILVVLNKFPIPVDSVGSGEAL